ncbi:MAG: hypothetical protein WA474_07640, partial [Candidatus Sulfotelmatobacter sp.]
ANHEQFRGSGILNDCGSQALHFFEVDLHRNSSLSLPALAARGKQKARCAFRVSGLGFPTIALGHHPKCSADTLIAW